MTPEEFHQKVESELKKVLKPYWLRKDFTIQVKFRIFCSRSWEYVKYLGRRWRYGTDIWYRQWPQIIKWHLYWGRKNSAIWTMGKIRTVRFIIKTRICSHKVILASRESFSFDKDGKAYLIYYCQKCEQTFYPKNDS